MDNETFNKIKKVLGVPFYQNESVLIYNCDCLSAMKKLPENLISLTVTSPPYNIGKEYEKILPLDKYISWCMEWINEIYRLTLSNGAFFLNLGYISIPQKGKAIPLTYLLWDKIPFYLV